MNIKRNRKPVEEVRVDTIKIGACFVRESNSRVYMRIGGSFFKADDYFNVPAVDLADGQADRFRGDSMVIPVGVTATVEE